MKQHDTHSRFDVALTSVLLVATVATTVLLYRRGAPPIEIGVSGVAIIAALGLAIRRVTVRRGDGELGQYTLEERIGAGGMGEVYRARHAMLRRPTAIKLLRPEHNSESMLRRFEREVQLTAQLSHPNTIEVYDYGRTPDGVFYYAMEFLDGVTLEQLVAEFGPQPPGRVIGVLRQVCSALAEAHEVGLIHRDIKPANIILSERGGEPDVAKILDFGLVKSLSSAEATLTNANALAGTPHYLTPEMIRDPTTVEPRTDLYALGAVGYFLLAGRPVFEADSIVEVCSHHLHTVPEPPSAHTDADVPADLETVLLRCLEKDVERRPRDARHMFRMLGECADAGAWTRRQAASWWDEFRARPVKVADPSPETAATLEVDLANRAAVD